MAPIKADLHAVTSLLFTFTTSKMRLRICGYFPYFRVFPRYLLQFSTIVPFLTLKAKKTSKNTIKSTSGNPVSDAVVVYVSDESLAAHAQFVVWNDVDHYKQVC